MKLFHLLLRTSWMSVTLAAFTGFLSGACSAGLIALINFALKKIELRTLPTATLAWSFLALCLLLLGATVISQVLVTRLGQEIIVKMQMRLSRRILDAPLQHLEKIGSDKLLVVLTEDVDIVSAAALYVSSLFINIALLAGCLIYLSWLSVPVFLFLLVFMVLGTFIYMLLVNGGKQDFQQARDTKDRLYQIFRTTTEGTKELKLHRERRQAFLSEELQVAAEKLQQFMVSGMTIYALAASWGMMLFFIPIGLLIFGLPQIVNIPVSVLSSYALTIIFIMTPLRGILTTLPPLSRANISLEKIESLGLSLAAQTIEEDVSTLLSLQPNPESIELVGVTHTYQVEQEENPFTLGPIDLTVRRGEILFIVGGNGSGKSTLVKLLAGLYMPETGVIQVDGKPITDRNREWYRQHFSVVFSDFHLFDRLLGLSSPDLDTQAKKYLFEFQLDHKVAIENGVLSTTALSQGQRKRLALLTAYLEDPPHIHI